MNIYADVLIIPCKQMAGYSEDQGPRLRESKHYVTAKGRETMTTKTMTMRWSNTNVNKTLEQEITDKHANL